MNRRRFVGALAGGLVVAPSLARSQSVAKVHRIGSLGPASAETPLHGVLIGTLRDLGYVEGRNVVIERRHAGGRMDRLPQAAADLVRLSVDVIVAISNPSVAAAKRATTSIPIVMVTAVDPVGAGFIASLGHPGGNITGVTIDADREIFGKNLGLLTEAVPGLSRVGVLRQIETGAGFEALKAAAHKLNVELYVVDVRHPDDFEGAFAAMSARRVGALILMGGSLTYLRRQQIADLALKYRLAAIHAPKEYAQAGLLMTNGPSLADNFRQAAGYVDKILRGARPGDLPVEQPTRFELVINLRTAKALGLTVPQSLLLRADEVIR